MWIMSVYRLLILVDEGHDGVGTDTIVPLNIYLDCNSEPRYFETLLPNES